MSIFRKLTGRPAKSETGNMEMPAVKVDQQTADVANASQRVSERTEQVRATLAELLKRNDGDKLSIRGL